MDCQSDRYDKGTDVPVNVPVKADNVPVKRKDEIIKMWTLGSNWVYRSILFHLSSSPWGSKWGSKCDFEPSRKWETQSYQGFSGEKRLIGHILGKDEVIGPIPIKGSSYGKAFESYISEAFLFGWKPILHGSPSAQLNVHNLVGREPLGSLPP